VVTALEQLKHAIGVLAAAPEEQQTYLMGIRQADNKHPVDELTNIDELGLEFEDATYLVSRLLREQKLTNSSAQQIERLNSFLGQLSGMENKDFWTIRALYEDLRWDQVRTLARECLSDIV
jgi:hypothetical protein